MLILVKKNGNIWKHFTTYKCDGGVTCGTCKKSDKRMKVSTGTTNSLLGHLKSYDPNNGKEMLKGKEVKKET